MRLTKHHGLGNDFLVLLDLGGARPISEADAVALCDRHRGIGADGIMRVTAGTGGADVTMELYNADGSRAEMSGNGIRCLAQAVFEAGVFPPPDLAVMTDAGVRTVRLVEQTDLHTQRLMVDMGVPKVEGDEPRWLDDRIRGAVRVGFGNPHVVLLWDEEPLPDPAEVGTRIDAATPGGANVELIRPGARPDLLEMVVHERGVGPTLACGTGACAAVVAARGWNLVGDAATVAMPGGVVEVAGTDPVTLTGEAVYVAAVDVPWPDRLEA